MSRELVEDMILAGVDPKDIDAIYQMGRESGMSHYSEQREEWMENRPSVINCHKHGLNYAGDCPSCFFDPVVEDICRASDILSQAAAEMKDRGATYDQPEGERSMGKTVAAFAAVTGVEMTEQQGWQFMELLKMVRSNQGGYRADSFVDGAAYASLAGEAAAKEKGA